VGLLHVIVLFVGLDILTPSPGDRDKSEMLKKAKANYDEQKVQERGDRPFQSFDGMEEIFADDNGSLWVWILIVGLLIGLLWVCVCLWV